ncbi:unnamed protein product [marine sediment metagenome]|uniref:Uncharacterized protein n=1 Tax=marine sediment metagenome TaxID=412755 RepID=X1PI57_9ZZZZ
MNSIAVASTVSDSNKQDSEEALKHQSDALDEALAESFPASDPVAVDFTRVHIANTTPNTSPSRN